MLGRLLKTFAVLAGALWTNAAVAEPLRLYIDADYSIATAAAENIELGIRTALAEVDHELGGLPVVIMPKNHRANVKRSLRTMQQFLDDSNALAVIGGMHSPPYLSNQRFINQNRILTLLPWSAAGPITRAEPGQENWIFRLSVDDAKAGGFLVNEALKVPACDGIALVLVNTGWGRANQTTMLNALQAKGLRPSETVFFSNSLALSEAEDVARSVAASGANCVLMLATATSGAKLIKALHEVVPNVHIKAHWGILGGPFASLVPHDLREATRLRVLQTCGLRVERSGSPQLDRALSALPNVSRLSDLSAPTGFVHGYDLGRLLISAAQQASETPEWQGGIEAKRTALHAALENLKQPVSGILKPYVRPFRPYNMTEPDAHEALGGHDLCMASFGLDGRLVHDH